MGLLSGLLGESESPDFGKSIKDIQAAQAYGKEQYGDFRKQINPYIQAGGNALSQFQAQMGMGGDAYDVTQLPGYQAALKEGLGAVNAGAAGSGMLMSGSRLKGLQSAGQRVFGDYYNNYMNRLSGMMNMGQSSVMGMGQLGQQAAGLNMQGAQGTAGYRAQQGMLEAQAANADRADTLGLIGSGIGMMAGGGFGGMFGGGAAAAPAASGGSFNAGFGGAGGGMDVLTGGYYSGGF